jgi:hypothetical protein
MSLAEAATFVVAQLRVEKEAYVYAVVIKYKVVVTERKVLFVVYLSC